jgi:hypothetical protein
MCKRVEQKGLLEACSCPEAMPVKANSTRSACRQQQHSNVKCCRREQNACQQHSTHNTPLPQLHCWLTSEQSQQEHCLHPTCCSPTPITGALSGVTVFNTTRGSALPTSSSYTRTCCCPCNTTPLLAQIVLPLTTTTTTPAATTEAVNTSTPAPVNSAPAAAPH